MPIPEAIGAAIAKSVEAAKEVKDVVDKVEKVKGSMETATAQKDGDWGAGQVKSELKGAVKEEIKKTLSDKLGDYFKTTDSGESIESLNEPAFKSEASEETISGDMTGQPEYFKNGQDSLPSNDMDNFEKIEPLGNEHDIPYNNLKEKLNDYFKFIDDAEKHDNSSDIANHIDEESKADSTTKTEEVPTEQNHEADELLNLRDLTQEERDKLKEIGMSNTNIDNCKVDENGIYHLKTINEGLEGKKHPVTGVEYVRKQITVNGVTIEGVFPKFDTVFSCMLDKDNLQGKDLQQFDECMKKLREAVDKDPELASKFTKRQLEQIHDPKATNVSGYTWHHNEETGKMELVKTSDHASSSHTGGKTIWGGGKDNR